MREAQDSQDGRESGEAEWEAHEGVRGRDRAPWTKAPRGPHPGGGAGPRGLDSGGTRRRCVRRCGCSWRKERLQDPGRRQEGGAGGNWGARLAWCRRTPSWPPSASRLVRAECSVARGPVGPCHSTSSFEISHRGVFTPQKRQKPQIRTFAAAPSPEMCPGLGASPPPARAPTAPS